MRARFLVLAGALSLLACSGGGGQPGGEPRDVSVNEAANDEGLFGDWVHRDGSGPLPDGAMPDAGPDAVPDTAEDAPVGDRAGDTPAPEVVVPVEWDVLVLTALKGHLYLNGTFLTVVQNTSGASFVGLDGLFSRFYSLTDDGQVRVDGEPAFEVAGVPAGDTLVTLRVLNGQFYALIQAGKVLKNGVVVQDLAAKAAPPFVGLDVTPDHVYVLSRACKVFEEATEIAARTPFTGDYCAALAVIHSLD